MTTVIFQNADKKTISTDNSMLEYDEEGKLIINLTNCTRLHDFVGTVDWEHPRGGITDDGWGLYLRTGKEGNNLIIEYDGVFPFEMTDEERDNYDWSKYDEDNDDWINYKRLVIKDYFTEQPDIKIKVYATEINEWGSPNLKAEPEIFDLKDIAFNCEVKYDKKTGTITGTFLSDDIDGEEFQEDFGFVMNTIKAEGGNDIIRSYKGDQKIYAGTGNNTLIFGEGDGKDEVHSTKGGVDTLVFEGIESDGISFNFENKDLLLKYGNNDSVRIIDYLQDPSANSVKFIQFGYNEPMDFAEFLKAQNVRLPYYGSTGDDTIIVESGNNTIHGYTGTNTFIFNEQSGNCTIYSEGGKDILDLTQVKSVYSGIFKDGDTEQLNFFVFKEENNLVIKYNGEYSTNGEYVDYNKIILKDYFVSKTQPDIKIKMDTMYSDKTIFDLKDILTVNMETDINETESQTIEGSKYRDYLSGGVGNDILKGNGGNDTILGNSGDDTIYGGDGDDYIYGDAGNDTIYGEGGNNKIFFRAKKSEEEDDEGRYSEIDEDTVHSGKGTDTLVFEDLEDGDLSFESFESKDGNLIIHYAKGHSVKIKDYVKNAFDSSVKFIQFGSNEPIEFSKFLENLGIEFSLNINKPKESANLDLRGSKENDTIISGKGDDIINGRSGNDIIKAGKGINTIIINNNDGKDTIYYENGTDIIDLTGVTNLNAVAENGNIITEAEKRNKDLVIYYQKGDDNIADKTNEIRFVNYFTNGQKSDIKVKINQVDIDGNLIEGDPVIIDMKEFATLDIEGKGSFSGTFLSECIDGSDGKDTIHAGAGNDNIYGGKGNDNLYGDSGNNVFEFEIGDGNDTVNSGKGEDIIRISNCREGAEPLSKDNIELDVKNSNLVIKYSDKDSIILANYFSANTHSVKTLELLNNDETITLDIAKLVNEKETDPKFGNLNKKNTINGTVWNDTITGGNLADTIKGGYGDDTIIGGKGNDNLYGDAGDDTFIFSSGDGNDTVNSGKGSDTLMFDDVNPEDLVFVKKGNNLVIQYTENDSVTIVNYLKKNTTSSIEKIKCGDYDGSLSELIEQNGYQAAKNINYSKLNEAPADEEGSRNINGSSLNDTIVGSKGDDVIYGGRGHDTLKGGNGDDEIYGGTGNDKLYGDAGDDTFYFNEGDGNDIIYNGSGNDTIRLLDADFTEESIYLKGNSLVINYGENDSIELNNYLKNKTNSVKTIINTEKQVDLEEFLSHEDFFGVNIIGTENKKNTLNGTKYNDNIIGGDLADTIKGGAGNDDIDGGKGDDKLYGGTGNNTFYFNTNAGNDTVYTNGGNDTLYFENANDIKLSTKGNDLVIKYKDGEGNDASVTINNYIKLRETHSVQHIVISGIFDGTFEDFIKEYGITVVGSGKINGTAMDETLIGGSKADTISGGNGNDVLYGNEGNDTLKGGNGDDEIYGGTGNDNLYGDAGDDTFYFNEGDGNDIIYNGSGNDTIRLLDADFTEESIYLKGNSLVINYGENDSIELNNYLKNKTNSVKTIIDKNGEPIELEEFLSRDNFYGVNIIGAENKKNTLNGTKYNDYIVGGNLADTIKGGAGNDTIKGGKGNDNLYGGTGKNKFYFVEGDGNDTIYNTNGGEDTIYIDSEFSEESIYLKGNSLVINYGENDSIELNNYLKNTTNSVKTIIDKNGEPVDLEEFLSRDNFYGVNIIGTVNKKNTLNGTKYNDYIVGGNLADTIKGGAGNDIIIGGKGNDNLYGGTGKNKFYFVKGDGNDTIYNTNGGEDTIYIDADSVKLSAKDNDLIINYFDSKGNKSSITVNNYVKLRNEHSVKTININGTECSLEEYIEQNDIFIEGSGKINGTTMNETIIGSSKVDTISGGDGNDILYGKEGNDTLKGGNGDDILYGGTGNDKLYGEAGNNIFYFEKGDGNDTVYMGSGNDSLVFEISPTDTLTYKRSGNNLIIGYGDGDSVVIDKYFSSTKSIKNIAFSNDNPLNCYSSYSLINSDEATITVPEEFQPEEETMKVYKYKGDNSYNLIIAADNDLPSYIETSKGNNTVQILSRYAMVLDDGGDDNYIINSLDNSIQICDKGGYDTVQILEDLSNVHIVFNVLANNYSGTTDELGMLILNTSSWNTFMESKDVSKVNTGVEICNFINENGKITDGAIERIETKDGYFVNVNGNQIDDLRNEVAGWLATEGFSDTMDAMARADENQLNALIAMYEDIWQPIA